MDQMVDDTDLASFKRFIFQFPYLMSSGNLERYLRNADELAPRLPAEQMKQIL